jgi:hypothetical protein
MPYFGKRNGWPVPRSGSTCVSAAPPTTNVSVLPPAVRFNAVKLEGAAVELPVTPALFV